MSPLATVRARLRDANELDRKVVLVPGQTQREDDGVALDYEYIDSLTCYPEVGDNVFDRLAQSRHGLRRCQVGFEATTLRS